MKPVETPSSDIYQVPRDFSANKMHYGVVQVSKHRHVVVQYSGTTSAPEYLPCFVIVSEPLKFSEACDLAKELTEKRNG